MARTKDQRMASFKARLEAARSAEKRARDAGPGYGNEHWADHFELVALSLEQKIYELNLEMDDGK